jgi:hypothetical protein
LAWPKFPDRNLAMLPPALGRNVYYKNTHLKQYHKEGRGLRTETTINNTYEESIRCNRWPGR